jgi:DNA-binding transcriptional MerR regulator
VSESDLDSMARQCGITRREMRRYVELEMITPSPGEVTEATRRRLRRIRRLQQDLDIDLEVVAIIVRLLDRIQELEGRRGEASRLTARVIGDR